MGLTLFCKHLLSLRAGETLLLVSKQCDPWWEAERNGVSGFVGSNYVVESWGATRSNPDTSRSSRNDSSTDNNENSADDHTQADFNDTSDDEVATLRGEDVERAATAPPAAVAGGEATSQHRKVQERDSAAAAARSGSVSLPVSPVVKRHAGQATVANPLFAPDRARPAAEIAPKFPVPDDEAAPKRSLSKSSIGGGSGSAKSSSDTALSPLKRSLARSRSGSAAETSQDTVSGAAAAAAVGGGGSGGGGSGGGGSGSRLVRTRTASVVATQNSLFGMSLAMLMPRAHSPPMFLVRLLAKLEGSKGIEAPEIFLRKVEQDKLEAFKNKVNANDLSVISSEKNPYMLASVLLEWLKCLPLSVIPPDMYVLFSEAEKIHSDDEHLLHAIHSLINSMPKAHRTCLQYVCFIFKNVAAAANVNGMTLERLSPIVAPVIMRPRTGAAALVISPQNATLRMQRFRGGALGSLPEAHIDELPPLPADDAEADEAVAQLRAEYDRRAAALVPGKATFELLIKNFGEVFMNEGPRMRFTTKPGEARDVLSAGTLDVVVHKLYDKYYVDMLDPEFPHMILMTRDYFVAQDVDLLRLLRETYLKHRGSQIPWKEVVRLRVLNVLKLFADNYLPELGIVDAAFADMWATLCKEMEGEHSIYNRTTAEQLANVVVLVAGSPAAEKALANHAALLPQEPTRSKTQCVLTAKTDLVDLATALTLCSSDLFRHIQPSELMHRNWQRKETSPNYSALVENFALYQGWVVHQILTTSEKERARVITQVVDVAFHLLAQNNFHVCFAVYAGAAHPSVSRLKVWEKLGKVKERLAELTTLFDPSLNHKNYQTALRAASQPVIPQISMYSKYLFAIEENNEDWVTAKPKPGSAPQSEQQPSSGGGGGGGKLVNVQKLRMLYVLMKQLRQYQRVAYTLRVASAELHAQVRSNALPFLEEKAMYELSQKVQPREKQ